MYGSFDTTKQVLEELVWKFRLPCKPEPTVDLAEFKQLKRIKNQLVKQSQVIRKAEDKELTGLKKRLSEMGKWFNRKERKALEEKIIELEDRIVELKEQLNTIVVKHGYASVRDFMKVYEKSENEVLRYEKRLRKGEENQNGKQPDETSIKEKLRQYQQEIKVKRNVLVKVKEIRKEAR